MVINVIEERKGDKANIKTLDWVEKRVEQAIANNEDKITIDFSGVAINDKFVPKLGELRSKYHVSLVGLGSKEDEIDAYVGTGYFLKEMMDIEEYTDWFIDRIKEADYPLMIMDNRVARNKDNTLEILQPLHFKENRLVYRKLKPAYIEPRSLEKALQEQVDIWRMDSLHRTDIANKETGLRFASNMQERTILDLIDGILNKKYTGFQMREVR